MFLFVILFNAIFDQIKTHAFALILLYKGKHRRHIFCFLSYLQTIVFVWGCILVWFFDAVINAITKTRRKEFISVYTFKFRCIAEGRQGRNWSRSYARIVFIGLLSGSFPMPVVLQLSCTALVHLPRVGHFHSQLGSPTPVINEGNVAQACPQLSLI